MMKKFVFSMIFILCLFSTLSFASASNEAEVIIPDYEVVINGSPIYYYDSIYPMLSYKDITYFPMTYDYCRALSLSTSWVEGKGLYIVYQPESAPLPVYETTTNKKKNTAVIPEYPIYVNGREIDNKNEEYPLLNFRGVTYFPMTWDYAHEEFSWKTSWENGRFSLNSVYIGKYYYLLLEKNEKNAVIKRIESVEVENPDGSFSSAPPIIKHFLLDYEDSSLTPIEYQESGDGFPETEEVSAEIKNGKIYYEGNELSELECIKNGTDEKDVELYAEIVKLGNTAVYSFSAYYNLSVPAPYTPCERFLYVKAGEKLALVGKELAPYSASAAKCGDNIYISAVRYTGFRGMTFSDYTLFCVSPDGSVSIVNESFPDYGSMKLIGEAGGKLYLKCMWGEETATSDGPQRVSAVNDGYFSYDGENLVKLSNYVYTNDDFVTPCGKIYSFINWKDEIKRIY